MFFFGSNDRNMSPRDRYFSLRRGLLVVMMLITVIPLCLTAILSFYQYRRLVQEETISNAYWRADSARQTIEAFLERLQAAILVISEAYTFDELADQSTLGQVFERLKRGHEGLVDLSVIGPNGIQRAYAGPYNLTGKDYRESPWYGKALAKKIYVSDVFTGFRDTPHFVVVVTNKDPGTQDYWVLRASIDTDTLDRFLVSVDSHAADDVFLVNNDWKLQSSSRFYGGIGSHVLPIDSPKKSGIVLSDHYRGTTHFLRASGNIKGTPWILVLEQQGYSARKTWQEFKRKLLIILSVSILSAGFSVVRIATLVAKKIRDADEAREAIFSHTEHTSKLASIGRLAAGVAHEINNPLAIINEKAGLMKDILGLSEDFQHREKFLELVDALQKAVNRSRAITHRLLGFARRMDVTLGPVQLNGVVSEVMGFLDKEALYRNIRVEQDLQVDLPSIQSDHGKLQQIFLNIINNAIDAVDKDGVIQIRSRQENRQSVRVDISDNGPGIPPHVLKNIFEPFFTTKQGDEKRGTGLGLSITYGLVKSLGGEISVSSDIGLGTTFSIILPVQAPPEERTANGQA